MNPYEVLCVDRNANEKTIKAAYRKLARKWHPDLFHTETEIKNAELKMKEINEAFDILKIPEKKAAYDAENPVSVNVYEYYANKQTKAKGTKNKKHSSTDFENEKQRKAVVEFLNVEYEHKKDIFDYFAEIAKGTVTGAIATEEDYQDYLSLVLEEQKDCITKIRKIVQAARARKIKGLEHNFRQAEEVIQELIQKANEIPKSLKQAHYVEETRILTEQVNDLMKSFRGRVNSVTSFDLLRKTWEFNNDEQLNNARKKQVSKVNNLIKDIEWVEKTALERHISIGGVIFGDPNSRYSSDRCEITLNECKQMVEKCRTILDLNLKQLRQEFWDRKCSYTQNSEGEKILRGMNSFSEAEKYKGTFICPPDISYIDSDAFYWLQGISAISIPAHLIKKGRRIELPSGPLKKVIITFDTQSHSININNSNTKKITREGDYICISNFYSSSAFTLVDAEGVYDYDDRKLCELNGIQTIDELKNISERWDGYQLQIHVWAQVVKRLPNPNLMKLLPASVEAVREWVNMDKTNFENAISLVNDEELKIRVIRLYIALGALNGEYCHAQAEWLISKLDVNQMYRSRLERFPKEKKQNEDSMLYIPKSAVDLVQENIDNKEFLPYVFAFLEGYKLFKSEAKKANVELSPEFIMNTVTQYIFHRKVDNITTFVKQLIEAEKDINVIMADKIIRLYSIAQRNLKNGINKNIVETVDNQDGLTMNYKFMDLYSLESYLALTKVFKCRSFKNRYYGIEAENVFISSNSHAIEILDGENNRIAIAILNLLDEGELFADIMSCEDKSVDVLEAIKRALFDQKKCNNKVTGISIGMNEAPRTSRYNEWRSVIQNSDADWLKEVRWIKFQYLFESREIGDAYKGYRVRFIVDGKQQYLSSPEPWDNPRKSRRRRRRGYY